MLSYSYELASNTYFSHISHCDVNISDKVDKSNSNLFKGFSFVVSDNGLLSINPLLAKTIWTGLYNRTLIKGSECSNG
jgi:hypothetical protein